MDTTNIFRIEKDGLGPWSNYDCHLFKDVSQTLPYGLVSDCFEAYGIYPQKYSVEVSPYYCAFPDKDTMQYVFDYEDLVNLVLDGYKIYEIIIEKEKIIMGKSGKQCAFIPDDVIEKRIWLEN